MYPRKQLDIRWSDIARGIFQCTLPADIRKAEQKVEASFAADSGVLATLSVRTGFDLCLRSLALPPESEILMSGFTIEEMVDIAKHHGLVPIPLDLNLETLAPEVSALEAAISPRTKAVVIAHLFGARIPMEPILAVAKKHGLFVIEDCAQAYTGPEYAGHAESDVAMFSFGPIKTATALGGALIRVKDSEILEKMRAAQRTYPCQGRTAFLGKLFKHAVLKLLTLVPVYTFFYRVCVLLGLDFDQVISQASRGFSPEGMLRQIRTQPSFPLLALLGRRIRRFDAARLRKRAEVGYEFARSLPDGLFYPGNKVQFHSFWVFPVLADAPERLAAELHRHGFDATSAASALSVVDPPPGREDVEPTQLRDLRRKLLYLPVYPEVSARERKRLSKTLAELLEANPHLRVSDMRRAYSAQVQTIEAPRTVGEIKNALHRAKKNNAPICMMGSRHNLGGHAFNDGAVVLDMTEFNRVLFLDTQQKHITVESGITWDKVQEALNPAGLALMAMQSTNEFTVGGSLAANGHGRDVYAPTIIESVISFRLMLADGSVISVSRNENADFFGLVIGGYGLFGVVLDVTFSVVENVVYEQSSVILPLSELPEYFENEVRSDPDAHLFMARLSIVPDSFLDETIVTVWKKTGKNRRGVFDLGYERHVTRDRWLFGLSRKYEWGKALRWSAEKYISLHPPRKGIVSRNNAMRPPVSQVKMFDRDSRHDADMIQEFFIPIPRFLTFMEGIRSVLREHKTNLLGITVRFVRANSESVLSYAPREDALAAVIYFNEVFSLEGRAETMALIRQLIALSQQNGGTFYLTYLRDLEFDDLEKAYPGINLFFQEKQRVDPEGRFSSRFFKAYGKNCDETLVADVSVAKAS